MRQSNSEKVFWVLWGFTLRSGGFARCVLRSDFNVFGQGYGLLV